MTPWLEGKAAVVTGAGRGIGRAVALLLAEEGARVVVNDPGVNVDGTGHDDGPAEQVVAEIRAKGGNAVANFDSVATAAGGENIIKTALEAFDRVDILVNTAGILRDRMVFNMSEAEWDEVIAVHLKGHFNLIKPASILMRQRQWGRIVNFSSTSGLVGNSGQANYGAAKAGIAGLTRVVARDLGRYGITCNAIAPIAATRMIGTVPDAVRQRRARSGIAAGADLGGDPNPGRGTSLAVAGFHDAEFVAPMVALLATDYAWNINGQIFAVSGGQVSLLHHPLPSKTVYKQGMWTLDELDKMMPALLEGAANPAPPSLDRKSVV